MLCPNQPKYVDILKMALNPSLQATSTIWKWDNFCSIWGHYWSCKSFLCVVLRHNPLMRKKSTMANFLVSAHLGLAERITLPSKVAKFCNMSVNKNSYEYSCKYVKLELLRKMLCNKITTFHMAKKCDSALCPKLFLCGRYRWSGQDTTHSSHETLACKTMAIARSWCMYGQVPPLQPHPAWRWWRRKSTSWRSGNTAGTCRCSAAGKHLQTGSKKSGPGTPSLSWWRQA